jgi:hypothetical protein
MRNDLRSGRRHQEESPRRIDAKMVLFCVTALVVLVIAGKWTYNRFLKSDEDRILDAIHDAAQAARDRNPSGVTAILASDYSGPFGEDRDMAHQGMSRLLLAEFRNIEVSITPDPIPVRIDPKGGDTATVRFQAVVRGQREDGGNWSDINRRGGGSTFDAVFKRTSRGWRISKLTIGK